MPRLTIPEAELLRGLNDQARQAQRNTQGSIDTVNKFAAKPAEPAPIVYRADEIPHVWAEIDYDGRVRRCLVFTNEEAALRLAGHNALVHPTACEREGYVMTSLGKRRECLPREEEVTVGEYLRRYHRWARRYGAPVYESVTENDRAVIRQVTGWNPGSSHWYFRLLGWRDRPIRRT